MLPWKVSLFSGVPKPMFLLALAGLAGHGCYAMKQVEAHLVAVLTVSFGVTGYSFRFRSNRLLGHPHSDRGSRRSPARRSSAGDVTPRWCIGGTRDLEPVLHRTHAGLATSSDGSTAGALLTDPEARHQWSPVTGRRWTHPVQIKV